MNILIIYSSSQTYTSTVFEHLNSFSKYSIFKYSYADYSELDKPYVNISHFDAFVIHYSVRLAFGQLNTYSLAKLSDFKGLKVLFIQDEYDHTSALKTIMKIIGFNLVFSVVPKKHLQFIYPHKEFPNTRFINNLTGYAPDLINLNAKKNIPPSKRKLIVAYRGRTLPIWYGQLGFEKKEIGERVKEYCESRGIDCNISWDEASRVYGNDWYKFMRSAKTMLGSESGSNVFNWDGSLEIKVHNYRKLNRKLSDVQVYKKVIKSLEIEGLMNQVSPRIFEMAALKTTMILFEGGYSNTISPYKHYLPLKKDFSNLEHIFEMIKDDALVDKIADNAYRDLISTGKYSYQNFIAMVDQQILISFKRIAKKKPLKKINLNKIKWASKVIRQKKSPFSFFFSKSIKKSSFMLSLFNMLIFTWGKFPKKLRSFIRFIMGRS